MINSSRMTPSVRLALLFRFRLFLKIDTIPYWFPQQTTMPESREALTCVDATPLAVAFSAFGALSCIESSSTGPEALRAKGANPTFKEFTRQGRHLACIPTPA